MTWSLISHSVICRVRSKFNLAVFKHSAAFSNRNYNWNVCFMPINSPWCRELKVKFERKSPECMQLNKITDFQNEIQFFTSEALGNNGWRVLRFSSNMEKPIQLQVIAISGFEFEFQLFFPIHTCSRDKNEYIWIESVFEFIPRAINFSNANWILKS